MNPPDIALHDLGGAGPLTLYAHATGFHAHVWKPVTDHLPHLHNVAYDARGHGESVADPEWVVDWSVYGADAADVARDLSAADGPMLGVGHSMGGAALIMAALESPRSFRGLVVYEPIVIAPDTAPPGGSNGNFLAMGARKRRSSFDSFDAALANFSSKPPLNIFTPEALAQYVRHGFREGEDGHVHLRCRPEHEARTYEAGGNHRTWERLGDLTVPVWVVCGLPEEMQPSARTKTLAERIPDMRYIQLDHLGHFGPMQAPGEIAAIVAEASATFS